MAAELAALWLHHHHSAIVMATDASACAATIATLVPKTRRGTGNEGRWRGGAYSTAIGRGGPWGCVRCRCGHSCSRASGSLGSLSGSNFSCPLLRSAAHDQDVQSHPCDWVDPMHSCSRVVRQTSKATGAVLWGRAVVFQAVLVTVYYIGPPRRGQTKLILLCIAATKLVTLQ